MSLKYWGFQDRYPSSRLLIGALLLPLTLLAGCYDHQPGNPVDEHHYEHAISISADFSSASVQTYINRTHLLVGFLREHRFNVYTLPHRVLVGDRR